MLGVRIITSVNELVLDHNNKQAVKNIFIRLFHNTLTTLTLTKRCGKYKLVVRMTATCIVVVFDHNN